MKDWGMESLQIMQQLSDGIEPDYGVQIAKALSDRDAEIARLRNDRLERIASQQTAALFTNQSILDGASDSAVSWGVAHGMKIAKALITELEKEAK